MNIIPFIPAASSSRSWNAHELEMLVSVYQAHASRGDATAWDVGATELDDPQFFVVGPAPESACIVAISRVGRIYVLEDGSGHVLQEGASLEPVAARAKAPLGESRPLRLIARVTLALTAFRMAVEQKVEPILAEGEEILLRIAPQLASLV